VSVMNWAVIAKAALLFHYGAPSVPTAKENQNPWRRQTPLTALLPPISISGRESNGVLSSFPAILLG
jgi:hypothetical protein